MEERLSEHDSPGQSPGFLLWHALLRWQRMINEALQPIGLTHLQAVLLISTWWIVENSGERPNQTALAAWVGIDKMTVSQSLRILEREALVDRSPDEHDARAYRLAPTKKGSKLAATAIKAIEATDSKFFSGVEDKEALIRLLTELAQAQLRE